MRKCVRKRLCVKTYVCERLTVSDEGAGVIELAQSLLPIGVRRGVQRLYVYVYVYVHMYLCIFKYMYIYIDMHAGVIELAQSLLAVRG